MRNSLSELVASPESNQTKPQAHANRAGSRTSSKRRLLHSPCHQRAAVQMAVGVGARPEPPAPRPLQEQQKPRTRHRAGGLRGARPQPSPGFPAHSDQCDRSNRNVRSDPSDQTALPYSVSGAVNAPGVSVGHAPNDRSFGSPGSGPAPPDSSSVQDIIAKHASGILRTQTSSQTM